MAFLPTITPAFPSVPNLPGVPTINRIGSGVAIAVSDVSNVTGLVASLFSGPQWGIFDHKTHKPYLASAHASVVLGVDMRREARIADYPVEQGGFASFNKVASPLDVRVTFSNTGQGSLLSGLLSGGVFGDLLSSVLGGQTANQKRRGTFFQQIDQAIASLTLFDVVTPEITYTSMNIVHSDYRRTHENGVSAIEVDVWLAEVRVTATTKYAQSTNAQQPAAAADTTNAQNPAAQPTQSGGTAQTSTPSAGTEAAATPAVTQQNAPQTPPPAPAAPDLPTPPIPPANVPAPADAAGAGSSTTSTNTTANYNDPDDVIDVHVGG